MKVLMINGSRREKGCTYTALSIVAEELKKENIDSEIVYIGKEVADGNVDIIVKALAEKMKESDGLVVGSPVYYAGLSGEVKMVLDRFCGVAEEDMKLKPAAAVASARRAGTTATLDAICKYFEFSQMMLVSSRYWNMVHGAKPEDVLNDEEGVQIMRVLGKNMAWLLKSIEAGKNAGVEKPEPEKKIFTNYIR